MGKTLKVLISDKLADEGVKILSAEPDIDVDCQFGIDAEKLKKIIKDYDALIVRSGTTVTADIIDAADKLKVIGRAGVGLDNVDLKAATKKGIVAMNTPAGNTTSTAEHTISMILALSRNIPQAVASMKSGKWERSKFSGVELYGKTLGIIGFGRIGSTVAKICKAFGMDIVVYDPYLSLDVAEQKGVRMVELDDLYKQSDYITIHIPKSAETKGMISEKQFALMKPTVRLINCARGGIVNEDALAKALSEKRIAGAALDVFDQEPPDFNSPLMQLDNCVVTPHLGASTSEAQINVAIEIAECVRDALLGRGIVNAANFPSVDAQTYKILEPYIHLSFRLGKFAGQLVDGRVHKIQITYSGAPNEYKVAPLTLSVVNGLLQPVMGETVNYINALDVAKERAIQVEEVKSSQEEEFVNCIKVLIETDKEEFSVWGTLTSNHQPRIVKINDVYLEAVPEGNILFINNNDKPGLIGALGTVLGEEQVNIAAISLSREANNGGIAVSVVNVDNEISPKTMERIAKLKDIVFAKAIKV